MHFFNLTGYGKLLAAPSGPPMPQPVDFAALVFRGPAFPLRFEMRHLLPLFRQFEPQLPTRGCFTVERLRKRCRAAHLTEDQDLHLKIAALLADLPHVSG